MSLPLEKLDTRTFDQLVEEGRALIPRGAPAWTDHNYHDPGITLMELFAWLVESDLYRLDRTPEANVRSFLRLVGIAPHPVAVAETVITMALTKTAGGPVSLPAALQIADAGGDVIFQTAEPVYVSPSQLVAVSSGEPEGLNDHTGDNGPSGPTYPAFGRKPEAGRDGSALYLGFDEPIATLPELVSLYFWVGDAERAALDMKDWRRHYSARVVWEYYATPGAWTPLADVTDETRAFTLNGFVRFTAPVQGRHVKGGMPIASSAEHYFVRCRLASGRFDCPPSIGMVGMNAVRACHECDVDAAEPTYVSTGRASQVLQLARAPVVPTRVLVRISQNGVEDGRWKRVLEWDQVGPHDRAWRLSPEDGRVVFGDGRAGRVPPAGAEIRVTYATGGGAAGNVSAGALTLPQSGPRDHHNGALVNDWVTVRQHVSVRQPFPATGGAPAETIAAAKARAVSALAGPDRAVTLRDFEALALATPGVPIARAFALADYHPDFPCVPALGCVTVVVVPHCPDPRPVPSGDLLGEVARYLDRRRTVTTEVHVVGPCYTIVAVHARLHASDSADPTRLVQQARSALDEFLNPMRGGSDGKGWPVGRDVYRSEVMALLNGLADVLRVDRVELQSNAEDGARCGNARVCRHGLVAPGAHRITIA